MKAVAFFPKDRQTRVINEPPPQIASPSQAKVRMLEVGVCGTDRDIFAGTHGAAPPGSDYLVIGHESLGQVVEVGDNVKGLQPGQLVILMVRRPCPHPDCIACRRGRQDFCYTGDYTERGIKAAPGFMAEFVVDEESYIVPAPASLRSIAVLTEPLTIAEKALEQAMLVQQRLPWGLPGAAQDRESFRHHAAVLGAGPVGLLGAMALAARGFAVSVLSREETDSPQARIVQAIGGTYLPTTHMTMGEIARHIGRIDLVYEATGAAQAAFDLLPQLGVNGIFIFTGVPGSKGPFSCDTPGIMRDLVLQNQLIFGTVNAPRRAFEEAIADLALFQKRWPGLPESLITQRHAMGQTQDLLQAKRVGIKEVVEISPVPV